MTPLSMVSQFSGGKLVEASLADHCPIRSIGSVEYDPKIAAHSAVVFGSEGLIVDDVSNVDYRQWSGADYLHASPSCKKASVANTNRGESPEDIAAGEAVCRAIREIKPTVFTLENVRGYAEFEAFKLLLKTLDDLGYYYDYAVYNAADYGGAQTRRRLYVRAWRLNSPLPRMEPTHCEREKLRNANYSLFDEPLKPWRGWYEAVEDLIPTLPETTFAPWQLKRLKSIPLVPFILNGVTDGFHSGVSAVQGECPIPPVTASADKHPMRAFLYNPTHTDDTRQTDTPSPTVTAEWGGKFRAWLVEGDAAGDRPPTCRTSAEPAYTIKTAQSGGRVHKAWLESGRVVKITPRALARFQGTPDWYPLPPKDGLATTIIGNGVSAELQRAISLPLLYAIGGIK